jgi:hypothetical protein
MAEADHVDRAWEKSNNGNLGIWELAVNSGLPPKVSLADWLASDPRTVLWILSFAKIDRLRRILTGW